MIEQLLSPAAWGSPIGIGIFLICLSFSAYLLSLVVKDRDLDQMITENMDSKTASQKKKKL